VKKSDKKITGYNVRIIDNHDGSFSIGFVSRFKPNGGGGGEWVEGNRPKLIKLLKGEFKS